MIGTLWTNGITLTWRERNGGEWGAEASFRDHGFCEPLSTQGTLETRYMAPSIGQVLDTLIADLTRLGISLGMPGSMRPGLYAEGDGKDPRYPYPDGWRDLFTEQARRLGWSTYGYDPALDAMAGK